MRGTWHALAVGGHLALLALVAVWAGRLAEGAAAPAWARVAAATAPLLVTLPGLLRARPRALVWVGLVVLVYFTHGVVEAWAGPRRLPALLEIVLACLTFAGCALEARARRLRQAVWGGRGRDPRPRHTGTVAGPRESVPGRKRRPGAC